MNGTFLTHNKDTGSLNSTEQEIFNQHIFLYKNPNLHQNFLDTNFHGLKDGDDVVTLLATMASRSPDSTIAVRAANENSVKFKKTLITMNGELEWIIKLKGVGDLKNCYHYFSGVMTQFLNDSKGNFDDLNYICNIKITLNYARSPPVYKSDSHISVFLRLFKSGMEKRPKLF